MTAVTAYADKQPLAVGPLLTGTFHELVSIRGPLLLYLGVFVGLGLIGRLGAPLGGLITLVGLAGYFLGQYLLYRALLRHAGLMVEDGPIRVFRFFGMALVLGMAIYLASAFFVIPGLILAAKWVMAPAYLVAGSRGTFESIGDSWRASSGNTLALVVAFGLLGIAYLFLVGMAGAFGALSGLDQVADNLSVQLALHCLPLLLMGLSVTAYRTLNDEPERLAEVFG